MFEKPNPTFNQTGKKLTVGTMGIAQEDIENDEKGWVLFFTSSIWIRVKVRAREAITKYDLVMVVDENESINRYTVSTSLASTRWGIPREPAWEDGDEQTAPGANTVLVSKTVSTDKKGRVFGVHITGDDGNQYQLLVDNDVVKRFVLGIGGTIHIVAGAPIVDNVNEGSTISIKNVTAALAGVVHQASILYDEA